MTIPSASNYPDNFDNEDNLYVAHDALRMTLAEDYTPGDKSIIVTGDPSVMANFPLSGIITLTEQCSEPELRALSFHYGSRTETSFGDLEVMPGFEDKSKPKRSTHVTQNVYADYHNNLKEAVIAIEEFIGVKGTVDNNPLGETLTGRINYLRKNILAPKAWFSSNKRIGIVPATVTFKSESLRNPTSLVWNFGDGSDDVSSTSWTPSTLTPIAEGAVPCGETTTVPDGVISHTYFTPGKYDVTLSVGNQFGQDTITIPDFFVARAPAPDEATITVSPSKVSTSQVVSIEVTDNGEQALDPVAEYAWQIGDDLQHASAPQTIALYSMGGIYDIKLRVDTELGAYRITKLAGAVNVVEPTNLYLFAFDSPQSTLLVTKNLRTYEFGLLSETFKSEVMPELAVERDYTFTNGYNEESYQRDLFLRNVSFAPKGTTSSGNGGTGIMYWSEDENTIRFKQCEPFNEVWDSAGLTIGETESRNWNWLGLNSPNHMYILFGVDSISDSPTDVSMAKTKHSLSTLTNTTDTYVTADFLNGAEELETYPDSFPATYRSCYQGNNGFFARNDVGPGGFFRIRNFYRTEGVFSDTAMSVRKLPDIPGTARTELEMVPLASGIFVFNNSGEVAAYNPTTNVWTTGGPGVGSATFRSLQDGTVAGFADASQPLLAASDGDRTAYLSYSYSAKAFIKFNESDLTFTSIGVRPTNNEQFVLTVF